MKFVVGHQRNFDLSSSKKRIYFSYWIFMFIFPFWHIFYFLISVEFKMEFQNPDFTLLIERDEDMYRLQGFLKSRVSIRKEKQLSRLWNV